MQALNRHSEKYTLCPEVFINFKLLTSMHMKSYFQIETFWGHCKTIQKEKEEKYEIHFQQLQCPGS